MDRSWGKMNLRTFENEEVFSPNEGQVMEERYVVVATNDLHFSYSQPRLKQGSYPLPRFRVPDPDPLSERILSGDQTSSMESIGNLDI